jgi:predicted outer membrane repeat protein
MRTLLVAVCMALVALVALPASATRIVVDQAGGEDFETIQEGVDAAATGDTVLVIPSAAYTGPGNRDIDFHGKNITLEQHDEHMGRVWIDCESLGRGFHFTSSEDTTAVVRRFTVVNGRADVANGHANEDGGAVYCAGGASPVFEWCAFGDNYAARNGGAVYCLNGADARFRECEFNSNDSAMFGGGVYAWSSATRFYRCVFSLNTSATQGGGAAMCYLSPAVFTNCNFSLNSVELGQGGAIYTQESDITVEGCMFHRNDAPAAGAISFWKASSPVIDGCDFADNSSTLYAGAVWCKEDADATITNSNFMRNDCPSEAAGIACRDASPTISNCVIAWNLTGSAVSCYSGAEMPEITHCYVFENEGGDTLCGHYHNNRFEDPLVCAGLPSPINFCSDSPCVLENNPWGEAVGRGTVGCGPCNDAVEQRSWGSIKGIYR